MNYTSFIRDIFKALQKVVTPVIDTDGTGISVSSKQINNLADGTVDSDAINLGQAKALGNYRNWKLAIEAKVSLGRLYNWYAVADDKNIAPAGWRVPTEADFDALGAFLGGDSVAGGKLKETGTVYWLSETGATNEYGFNGRGGGFRRGDNGVCASIRGYGYFWSSTPWGDTDARVRYLNTADTILWGENGVISKKTGCSLRLISDSPYNTGTVTGNDGRVYKTVKIGDQVWMAENSAETKYRDGSLIPVVSDDSAWSSLSAGAVCVYDNDESFVLNENIQTVLSENTVILSAPDGISFNLNKSEDLIAVEVLVDKDKLQAKADWTETDAQKAGYILNKPEGLVPQVQSDWNITDNTRKDFIKNKPAIIDATSFGAWKTAVDQALENLPEDQVQSDWNDADPESVRHIMNKPRVLVRPDESETNAVAVFTDPTGTEVKSSRLFVDEKGQMRNVVTPDENGYAVGDETVSFGSDSYGKVASAQYIPLLERNMTEAATGERNSHTIENTLIKNEDGSLIVPEVNFAFFDQYRFPHKRGGDPKISLQGQKHVVKYTDVTPGSECVREEWYLLKNGVLTLAMWLDADGLHANNSILSQNIFDITFPSAASVAGRIAGAVLGPGASGFTLSVASDSPNHLVVTHNLNREIAGVTVKATMAGGIVNGKRVLLGNNAYSGWIALDKNTLRIENLATDTKEITLHLLFS